jgi:primase-polymerase (primpol)-like protein
MSDVSGDRESFEMDNSLGSSEANPLISFEEDEFVVPDVIEDKEAWIGFRLEEDDDGKIRKVPKAPFMSSKPTLYGTSSSSRRNAVSFGEAIDFVHESRRRLGEDGADGIGFVLSDDDDVAGVDLDDCRDPETGEVTDFAYDVVNRLDSYTEVSPSGTGLHVLIQGELDDEFQQKDNEIGLEMYDSKQFLTFSGRWVPSTPKTIEIRRDEFLGIQRSNLPQADHVDINLDEGDLPDLPTGDDVVLKDEDERIIRKGKRSDEQFRRLWNGDISGYGQDHSRADFSLCCKLAFRTDGDIQQMDRIFRKSGLMREKWDSPRGNIRYGVYTMRKAVKKNLK